MRLVHFAHYPAPYSGSFVPMLLSVLRAARDRGWSAEAVLADDAEGLGWLEEFDAEELPVRFLPLESRNRRRAAVARLLAEERGPVLLHTTFTAFDTAVALAAARRPDAAVVWHVQSAARRDPVGIARNVAKFSTLGRLVDRILCVAPDVARDVAARGAPRSRVVYFPNAIETGRFPPAGPEERKAARTLLGLPQDASVVLHFGWDWMRKGGDLFLAAVRIAQRQAGKPIIGVTVGGGDPARTLSTELGLHGSLLVLPTSERVQTFYAAADVFVSPSRAEGMTFSVAEALSSGTAVVATAIPGQAALDAGLGALRLTGFDPAEIAAEICSLLRRPREAVLAEARAAGNWARSHFDLAPWSERLMAVYEEVLGNRLT